MPYQLWDVLQTRTILAPEGHVYFPDVYAGQPGYLQRHTPVLALAIPPGSDLVRVRAQVTITAKNATLDPPEFLWDQRFPLPPARGARMGGAFVNVQLRALANPPALVDAPNPPGLLLSTYSGENLVDAIIRPYFQPYRFGSLEPASLMYTHVALFVSPNSEGITHPQHLWLGDRQYALMEMDIYKKV